MAERKALEKWKISVEIIAIILAGLFATWKWGIEAYWSREDNYRAYFKDLSQDKQSPVYLEVGSEPNGDYLTVSGEVIVSNFSVAPIQIEKTFLYFVPFSTDVCDPLSASIENPDNIDCMQSSNTSSVFKKECEFETGSCKAGFKTVIHPIDDLPLFGKSDANRPFSVRLPASHFTSEEQKKGLFVIAEQEIGEACLQKSLIQKAWDFILFRSCKKSRALAVVEKLP
jgi:hypothetical protein